MRKRLLVSCCVAVALLGLTGCPGVACFGVDTCQLQGVWESKTGSIVTHRAEINDSTIKYTGTVPLFDLPGLDIAGGFYGTFEIRAGENPKQIDILVSRIFLGGNTSIGIDLATPRTVLGIYDVTQETLSFRMGTSEMRPNALDTENTVILTRVETQ